MTSASLQREHLRQQMLLRSLWKDNSASSLQGWLAQQRADGRPRPNDRAWQAYVAGAHANAERALAGCFPTVQQLLGDESFAAMARDYWHRHPPLRGDMAWLGEGLPSFISQSPQLSSEPYLADVAQLEWALNRCEAAADAPPEVTTLALLVDHDPQALRLQLAPGAVLISSTHPIVTIWQAHHEPADANDPFAAVREAFAQQQGEHALVWRQEWRARVQAVDAPTMHFLQALLNGQSLAPALEAAGPGWDFEAWLHAALPSGLFGRITFN